MICPLCFHEWSRHDPEDGRCDAPSGTPGKFDVCECGRSLDWMREQMAALSRAALNQR